MEKKKCPLGFNQTKNAGKMVDVHQAQTPSGPPPQSPPAFSSLPGSPQEAGMTAGPCSPDAGCQWGGVDVLQRSRVKLERSSEHLGSREGVLRLVLGFPVEMILSQPMGRRGTGEVG